MIFKSHKHYSTKLFIFPIVIFLLGSLSIFFYKNTKQLPLSPQLIRKIERCANCNVILVSFDDLRAKNVSALGYFRKTTPTIDRFAQESFNFTNAITVAPWTLPSHMSLFTGVYPSQHKVLNKFTLKGEKEEISNLKNLSPNLQTLADVLRKNGYRTGGFTGGAGVNHQFGFDQGFEVYTDDKDFGGFSESNVRAMDWIKNHQNENFFVFLHGYDAHGQYVPEGGYDKRFVDFKYKGSLNGSKEEQKQLVEEGIARGKIFLNQGDVLFLRALYDEKVQRADEKFAQFLKEYEKLGLMDKTIFILTSDHGEELYEHGRIDHGHSLYDELLRIPLVIKIPNNKVFAKIESQVSNIDIMPTILDLVGINLDANLRRQLVGESLVRVMEGERLSSNVYPETDYRYASFLRAVRTVNDWKLIRNLGSGQEELYQLSRDPEEKNDLAGKDINQKNLLDEGLNGEKRKN